MSRKVPLTGGEKESLQAALDRHRDVALWKIEGLDDEQLRRPMTPSGTNLLGMLKHLGAVGYGWFCETFGYEGEALPFDENDENADLRGEPQGAPAGILAFCQRDPPAAAQVIAG